jgi:hypothetical protein
VDAFGFASNATMQAIPAIFYATVILFFFCFFCWLIGIALQLGQASNSKTTKALFL